MILAVTITFWIILSVCAIDVIVYMFTSYQKDMPIWLRVFSIFWNIWIIFVVLISLGII